MRRVRNAQDLWAGLLFVAVGLAALVLGRQYPVGTTAAMGPGYFPRVLGGILVVLGAIAVLRSLRPHARPAALPAIRPRPLVMVLVAVVAFGVTLPKLGLVVASMLVVVLSRTAGPEFRWREVVVFGLVLTAFCTAVFVVGLKMPMSLWPAFLGG